MNPSSSSFSNAQSSNNPFNDNNSSIALTLQEIANSTSQILGCLVAKPAAMANKIEAKKQRPKPYDTTSPRPRANGFQEQSRPTGIILEYSDLMIMNEAVGKLNEVVTRLVNEAYAVQASTSQSSSSSRAFNHASTSRTYNHASTSRAFNHASTSIALLPPSSSSSTPTPISDDEIKFLQSDHPSSIAAGDISNPLIHDEEQLDPLLNISNGLSSCLKPCLIVSKDDESVYEYTIQKKRCGNEYYCCSSCRKLPSPRSNLVIYFDGKITCSPHNLQCIPISKDESLSKQTKRQIRFRNGSNSNNIVVGEE